MKKSALWLKHDAHFGEHPKTLRLRRLAGRQADAAECGWWRIVEGAKRYGEWTFESDEHLEHVAGRYAQFVELYREVGFIDGLTIHNADEYQTPLSGAERVAKYRERNAPNVTPDVTAVTPREEKRREEKTRADARDGLPSLTDDVASAWEQATGRSVIGSGQFAQDYIDDATRRHGAPAVTAAILRARQQFTHIPASQALTVAVRGLLDPLPDGKQLAAAEREQEQATASRRRVQETLRRTHYAHTEPVFGCPACQEAAA